MDQNTKVLRSKSSDTAIPKIIKKTGKKSRSSGEFNASVSKKRGVYVENTSINLSPMRGDPNRRKITKPPPRSPPGNKKFLRSVLTTLSKFSAAKQCQLSSDDDQKTCKSTEKIEDDINKKINMAVVRQNRVHEIVKRCSTNKIKGKSTTAGEVNTNPKTKKKYKSKVLNENLYGNSEFKKDVVTVLSTKKDFMRTPSNCSGRSRDHLSNSVKWSEMYIEDRKEKTKKNTEDLIKEIIEGTTERMTRDRKLRPKTQIDVDEKEDEKGVYAFFVDLLKTTISVNNFKTNASEDMPSKNETKNNLQINESVATRLNIKPVSQSDSSEKTDYGNRTGNEKYEESFKILPQSTFKEPERKRNRTERSISVRSDFVQSQNEKHNRSLPKNKKRKNLINMFKRELTMDDDAFEEPQNLYQALKIMAKTKKRIKFYADEMSRFQTPGDAPCMYKGRKVLALDNKSNKRYSTKSKFFKMAYPISTSRDSEASDFERPKGRVNLEEASSHSLEVFNEFDDLMPSH